jgi:hypothetical protein
MVVEEAIGDDEKDYAVEEIERLVERRHFKWS